MPRTALIVEDEVLLALDLRLMCEDLGLEVVGVVHSAAEALTRLPSLAPDVLLTDMQIGNGGDGVDVVEEVRRSCPQVNVVFVTAVADPATLARIAAACPDHVLSKPVSPRALNKALAPRHEHSCDR